MSFLDRFRHASPPPEAGDEEEEQDDADNHILNIINIQELLEKLKVENKIEYLEAWRKSWIERMNQIIDWSVAKPDNYADTITMLYKMEDFYTHLMMLISQAEVVKQKYQQVRKQYDESKNSLKYRGPEVG